MLTQLFLLYSAILLILFLPGYFLLQAIFGKDYIRLNALEKLLLSFVLSLFTTDFLMLFMNYLHISLSRKNLLFGLLGMSLFFKLIALRRKKYLKNKSIKQSVSAFSYRQTLLFVILLSGSIFLRGIYLADGIFPRSTDLGHHMYWVNYIGTHQSLPHYDAKFIIGEHLPFGAIQIFSHIPVVSAMPVTVLFLFNIFSLIAFFILAYHLADTFLHFYYKQNKTGGSSLTLTAGDMALWALFAVGILYPISAPQAKFISGGVVGNIIGNLLLLTALYAFLKTVLDKSKSHALLFVIILLTIIYTHHLSTLVLAYTLSAILLAFSFLTFVFLKFDFRSFRQTVGKYLKIFLNIPVVLFLLLAVFFVFQVRTPSYLNTKAISTAVGTPTKITRVGLSLPAIINRVGSWRVLFSLIFVVLLLPFLWRFIKMIFAKKENFGKRLTWTPVALAVVIAVLMAWTKIIFLMTWKPGLLKVDIPTGRIITYLTYPMALLAGFGFILFFTKLKKHFSVGFVSFLFVFFLGIGYISGLAQDIADNLRSGNKDDREVMQTYLTGMYLAKHTSPDDAVLKDHVYLEGDTWLKIFFMRDYKYPLSRTYDRRYNDPYNPHETCTRDMIAIPNSEIGQKCFEETHTKYIVLKKGYDDGIFLKSPEFQEVYSSGTVRVFEKRP